MKEPLLYSACWPNLRYCYYLINFPAVTIEQFDTYARQTYRNRYEILTANGAQGLSVPVRRLSHHAKTHEVEISYTEKWQHRHWRAITSAYGRSAFFEFFEDELRHFYTLKTASLLQYNLHQLETLGRLLRIDLTFRLTNAFIKNPADKTDLRYLAEPGVAPSIGNANQVTQAPYFQTFAHRHGFVANLSILDLLFNTGLTAVEYLKGNKL